MSKIKTVERISGRRGGFRRGRVLVLKGTEKSLSIAKKAGSSLFSVVRKLAATKQYRHTKTATKASVKFIMKAAKKAHQTVAKRPHEKLMIKSARYAKWHTWQYKKLTYNHVHRTIATAWMLIVTTALLASTLFTSALSTWQQSDWSGGQGSSTVNQFASKNNIDISSGSFSITPDEILTNGGFEENLEGWNHAANNGGSFASAATYPTVSSDPYSVASGDFNNDGHADIVTASYAGSISIFIGNGAGVFAPASTISLSGNPADVVTGDFNGDGYIDIAVARRAVHRVAVLINKNGAGFHDPVQYASGNLPKFLAAGDVNGDGRPDLVTANDLTGTLSVFINNGNGTFANKVDYNNGGQAYGVSLGDVNGDGHLDIVSSNIDGVEIAVFINNGDGTFANKVGYPLISRPFFGAALADYDGDGHLDIAVPLHDENTLTIYINNGDGTFGSKVDYPTGPGPTKAVSSDVDGDGDMDVIVTNHSSTTLNLFKNSGDGTFPVSMSIESAASAPYNLALADLNNDGYVDIASVNRGNNTLSVYLNMTDPSVHTTDYAYTGNGSAKLLTTSGAKVFYQTLDVGSDEKYTLEAFVYKEDGGAVTAADASLYADNATLLTTYTATTKAGWYKLTATTAGSDAPKKYGVYVAAGKTVFVDDISLKIYGTGWLASNIHDAELGAAWGRLSYNYSGSGSVVVKARTSNSADMYGAPVFAGCAPISSGTDMTGQSCVTDNDRYVQYEVTLTGDEGQTPVFEDITIEYAPYDSTPPSANASDIVMKKSAGGSVMSENDWTNSGTPYFEWMNGHDDDTGIKGYCLYLGTDDTADPVTTKGILGSSPLDTQGACQFAVTTNYIDTATANFLGTQLASSSAPYYLHIKAIDNAHNVYDGASESFHFRFDNTPPINPGFITAPSQFVSDKEVTMTWPTTGVSAPGDDHSGLIGLQYRIGGSGTWYGDNHNGNQDATDLLANDGSYTTVDPYDFDRIQEGNNVVYFRAWDAAGNVSAVYPTTVIKYNASSPSTPLNVTASPAVHTLNDFTFSWAPPASFQGSPGNLTYCYTINTIPTESTCTFTGAGMTSLPAGPYATQPGENTFYVVAKDEAGNINYATAGTTTFTANTAAPGIPLDVEIADVSTRATTNWRLALSWSKPTSVGAGVASYRIYRSIDNEHYTQVATTAGMSHVDAELQQQDYYYKVRACDSANNCGAYSAVVTKKPTGRFTSPANLVSGPSVSSITTKRAKVTWSTDRVSDSKVSIGKSSGEYSPLEVGSSSQVTAHSLELDNLEAGTTYYLKARWTDQDGNTGASSEISFRTLPAPYVKELSVIKVNLDSAVVRFTSTDASRAVISFGRTEALGGQVEVNTSTKESSYDMTLPGLDDGTKYYFRVSLFDSENSEYKGDLYSFTTPPRPVISDLRFEPVEGEPTSTQRVTWRTNVPATSSVSYQSTERDAKEIQHSKLKTDHTVLIRDLKDDSDYTLVASSRDAGGNLAVSDRQRFRTALDTRPPKVGNIQIEASIRGSGAEARGQVVVSWTTDEPATSQVAYNEGASVTEFNNRTAEDTALALEHIVIISDLPTSQIYSIQPISRDASGNEGVGDSGSAIIPRASDSVMSIVLNTIKRIFGI